MSTAITPGEIDPIIHERVRLAIVSSLAVAPEMSFKELKTSLGTTDGNLSAHARALEEAGYIEIMKSFQGRRPLTTMRLTRAGWQAFQKYLAVLQRIVEDAGGSST